MDRNTTGLVIAKPAGTTIRDLTRDQAKVIYKALFWAMVMST